jgi:hypothetical protein
MATEANRFEKGGPSVLHHLTIDLQRESYSALKRNADPVVDGVDSKPGDRRGTTFNLKGEYIHRSTRSLRFEY